MSARDSDEVISFPIKLIAEDEAGQTTDVGTEEEEDRETIEALTEFIKNTDRQGLQTLSKFAKNPEGMVEGQLMSVLGRAGVYGAAAAAIISLIVSTPEIIKTIVKQLAVKGGPLNQDWHRFFEDEQQLGFDRDLQYRKAVGLDVVIANHEKGGFYLSDPAFLNNSLVDIDTARFNRLQNKDTQYGYVDGL